MPDQIEKQIDLKAPIGRVWTALTDHQEFGTWFGMILDRPFAPGEEVRGKRIKPINPKMADAPWSAVPVTMSPQTYFSLTWHPFSHDPAVDYDKEVPTLVEFRLEPVAGGTRLQVTESGFDRLAAARRAEAFSAHEGGWPMVFQFLADYLAANAAPAAARVA